MESVVCKSVDIAAFIGLIHFTPGTLFEVRIPKVGDKTYAGYFDDPAKAALAIDKFDAIHKPSGIYISLNPVIPGKKQREKKDYEKSKKAGKEVKVKFEVDLKASNVISIAGAGTQMAETDAVQRNWFFVDIDPDRPAGTSATNGQVNDAIAMATQIETDLTTLGWPKPLRAMSGNGSYLLYRTDEPNDSDSSVLFQNCLYALIQKYTPHVLLSGEKPAGLVGIDKSVHNASRIAKAIGTHARKGEPTEDQPHRRSWYVAPDSPIEPVPTQLLNDLAALRVDARKATKEKRSGDHANVTPNYGSELPSDDPIIAEAITEAIAKLKKIPRRFADDRDSWLKIGMALHYTHHSLLPVWIEFSKQSTKYKDGDCDSIWGASDKSKGITGDTLNHYLPNEFEISKHIQTRLALLLDVDDEATQRMVFADCELFNKSQRVPMGDGAFLSTFQKLQMLESRRRSSKHGKPGSTSVSNHPAADSESAADPIDEETSNLPAMPEEIEKVAHTVTKTIEKLADQDSLTDEEKAKALRQIAKRSRAMVGDALPPAVEAIVDSWQLYRANEEPPVFTLEYYDSFTESRHRVELSTDQLWNFVSTRNAMFSVNSTSLPGILAKSWSKVIPHLAANMKIIPGNKYRDIEACMARFFLYKISRVSQDDRHDRHFQ